jgi:hypothetical protein
LLLASLVLLVIWYFAGGREETQWQLAVHQAAKGGLDISHADRYPHYGPLYSISLIGGLTLMIFASARIVRASTRKIWKAIHDRTRQNN